MASSQSLAGSPVQTTRSIKRVAVVLDMVTQSTRSMMAGIAKYASERGDWQISSTVSVGLQVYSHDQLESFDGMITGIAPPRFPKHLSVVYIGTPSGSPIGPTFCMDNSRVGERAAHYLRSLGAASFAFVGLEPAIWSQERGRSFCESLKGDGIKVHVYQVTDWTSWHGSETTMRQIADWLAPLPKPVALFGADDKLAVAAVAAAQSVGLRVPDEVAVLGVNDDDLCCTAVVPPLSSIRIPGTQQGYEAARCLDAMMHGKPSTPIVTRMQPGEVVRRGSTDVLSYADPLVCDAIRMIRLRGRTEPITVEEIADRLGVSRQHLTRIFKQYARRSVKEEIDAVRAAVLQDMLENSSQPIKAISSRMGFATLSHMSRFCTRVLKTSPRQVRSDRIKRSPT
jgi:LacI family transcriptional regulator